MLVAISVGFAFRIIVGVLAMYILARIGFAMLRALGSAPTGPPEEGEMRSVRLNYRCDVCGVELRVTLAPDEDPPPPVHCLEEMAIVAPTFE